METGGKRHAPAALPTGKETRYPMYRNLGGPQARSGGCGKFDPRTVQAVASRCTHWAIPAHIFMKLGFNVHDILCSLTLAIANCFAFFLVLSWIFYLSFYLSIAVFQCYTDYFFSFAFRHICRFNASLGVRCFCSITTFTSLTHSSVPSLLSLPLPISSLSLTL